MVVRKIMACIKYQRSSPEVKARVKRIVLARKKSAKVADLRAKLHKIDAEHSRLNSLVHVFEISFAGEPRLEKLKAKKQKLMIQRAGIILDLTKLLKR
ncbi:MAG: hypothetical protein AABW59_05205 [archaeon]